LKELDGKNAHLGARLRGLHLLGLRAGGVALLPVVATLLLVAAAPPPVVATLLLVTAAAKDAADL